MAKKTGMRKSTALIVCIMMVSTAILFALGTWQVKRLYWKEALIAKVEQRTSLTPTEINNFIDSQILEDDWPYTPIMAKGVYDHSKELFFFTTSTKGRAGWNVHTPMMLDNGKYLIVNRGFIPFELRNPADRAEGQVDGEQALVGLLRVPQKEKPNSFFPENLPEKREIYWRDYDLMTQLMGRDEGREFVPFFVDANDAPVPGDWPKGGTTIISFPNSHLQYAVTWYGLALALLGVGGYFIYSRRQQDD